MGREEIIFVGTSDLSGHFRGKSFPAADLSGRLRNGVGLAPTNIFMSAFGPIMVTPFGGVGEVFMIPVPETRVRLVFETGPTEHFYIGDIQNQDGTPWAFCPRHQLRRALDALRAETGLDLFATFEQEFTYSGGTGRLQPYALQAYRNQGLFGETLLASLREAGITPHSFLAEFGINQYEVTTVPSLGLRAADEAVITRELCHAVASRWDHRVSFTPLPHPDGTCSGTHIHWSFMDALGRPTLYDSDRVLGLSAWGEAFTAGILHHLPALCALTAPAPVSYYRLRPGRWAPVKSDLAALDRNAAMRICPLQATDTESRARAFNLEFRVADATASPYLALAALVWAGVDGIQRGKTLAAHQPSLLPASLGEALSLLERTDPAPDWLGGDFLSAYLAFKRAEIADLADLTESEICARYEKAY